MRVLAVAYLLAVSLAACVATAAPPRHLFHPTRSSSSSSSAPPYSTADCVEQYFTQRLDHFSFTSDATFQQRYYVCKQHEWWKGNGAPIFFYTGNEANVDLYVNMTGLMWENAQHYGAALVFAEHRYFGKSMPFPNNPMPAPKDLAYLTTDQAMMDHATLIQNIRDTWWNATDSPIIGFGGSYGGMLCAWIRAKYPNALDGCVSGSAPVIDFLGMDPQVDFGGFAQIETFDASAAGGAESDQCKANIQTVIMDMYNAATADAAAKIASGVGVCGPESQQNGYNMLNSFVNAIGMMAMGSYPFPSSYMMMGGAGELPPYPMRVACKFLSQQFPATADKTALYKAFGQAMEVFFAAAAPIPCINVTQEVNVASQIVDYLWDYLACTDLLMPSTMSGGNKDMFYPSPYNVPAAIQQCQQSYGVTPSMDWCSVSFGGRRLIETATNIVFTNGELDPWRFGGFNEDDPNKKYFNEKNKVVLVKNAGHHMELMFSNPADSETNVVAVRKMILGEIDRWILERTRDGAMRKVKEARLH